MKRNTVLEILPDRLKKLLVQANIDLEKTEEIRVRAGCPLLVRCEGKEKILFPEQIFTPDSVREIVAYLGSYSLYAYEDEIRHGYLTLPGGHRAGIAGRVVTEHGMVKTISDVASVNIRIAHEIKGCAAGILPYLWEEKELLPTLIVSPPGSGKTTLLRDCIRMLSDGDEQHEGKTVGVVDERSEIAGCYEGVPQNQMGMRTDVLDGCPKREGIRMLIRSMSPEVIAVDEISEESDLQTLRDAFSCGCTVLATLHGYRERFFASRSGKTLFRRFVFLKKDSYPGTLMDICDEMGNSLMVC